MQQGRPFREGIRENPALYYGLLGAAAVAYGGAVDFMPELNRWLQIVEMSSGVTILSLLVFVLKCWLIYPVPLTSCFDYGARLHRVLLHRSDLQTAVCWFGSKTVRHTRPRAERKTTGWRREIEAGPGSRSGGRRYWEEVTVTIWIWL